MGPYYDEAIRQQRLIAEELARRDRHDRRHDRHDRLDSGRAPLAETSPARAVALLCLLALTIAVPVILAG